MHGGNGWLVIYFDEGAIYEDISIDRLRLSVIDGPIFKKDDP